MQIAHRSILFILAAIAATACSGLHQTSTEESTSVSRLLPKTFEDTSLHKLDPAVHFDKSLSDLQYQPQTGDLGLDELLIALWGFRPPGPYRAQSSPNVLFLASVSPAVLDEFGVEDLAAVEATLRPPDSDPETFTVPEIFEWNSYGRCVPRFTKLGEPGQFYMLSNSEYLGNQYAEWLTEEKWNQLDAEFALGQYIKGDYADTLLYIVDNQWGGYALPLPAYYGEVPLPEGKIWVSSYAAVDFQQGLGSPNGRGKFVIAHELLHSLGNLDDLYYTYIFQNGVNTQVDMQMPGIMDNDYEPYTWLYLTGIHKFLYGWIPLLNVKYDVDNLVIRLAGIPNASRETYCLMPSGNIGREFFTLENLGVYPSQYMSTMSGLFVSHCLVPNVFGSQEQWQLDRSVPWCTWVTANGYEPWRNSGKAWKIPFELGSDHTEMLFPRGATELTEDGIPNTRRWDGSSTGIGLRGIEIIDNLSPAALPGSFSMGFEELELYRTWGFRYGLVQMQATVGRAFPGDLNRDDYVDQGDLNMLRANLGRRVGLAELLMPADVNGDGYITLIPDSDGDGYISTSERIYLGETLVGSRGDWIDLDRNAVNDLQGLTGLADISILDKNRDGLVDFVDRDADGLHDKVPEIMDTNGNGKIDEADAAVIGYHWHECAIEEIWVPKQPVPWP